MATSASTRGGVIESWLLCYSHCCFFFSFSPSCGSGSPASADPLPQGTTSGSAGPSGSTTSSCSDPCSSSSGAFTDVTTVFFPKEVGAVGYSRRLSGGRLLCQGQRCYRRPPSRGRSCRRKELLGVAASVLERRSQQGCAFASAPRADRDRGCPSRRFCGRRVPTRRTWRRAMRTYAVRRGERHNDR